MSGDRGVEQWVRDLQERTTGPVRVQLTPDYLVTFPVEVFDATGPGYVARGTLGLAPDLEDELVEWQRWWEAHMVDYEPVGADDEWRAWANTGERLVERVQHELGPGFSVRMV